MIFIRRTSDQWPVYSPWTGKLLTFDSGDAASAYITRQGWSGTAFFIDTLTERKAMTLTTSCKDHVVTCRPKAKITTGRDSYQRTTYRIVVEGVPLADHTTLSAKEAWRAASLHLYYKMNERTGLK